MAMILPVPLDEEAECATALAAFLNAGLEIQTITSGVTDDDLYTDYLLIGQMPVDS
jgi:hypothetical protein